MNDELLIAQTILKGRLALVGLADRRLRKILIRILRVLLRNRNNEAIFKAQMARLRSFLRRFLSECVTSAVDFISDYYDLPEAYTPQTPSIGSLIDRYCGMMQTEFRIWVNVADTLGKSESEIIDAAKTYIANPYGNPLFRKAKELRKSLKHDLRKLRERKVGRGTYKSAYNLLRRLIGDYIARVFSAIQYDAWQASNAIAYWVVRGSTFPCPLCATKVGYHSISDTDNLPPYHPYCECYAYPVYAIDFPL